MRNRIARRAPILILVYPLLVFGFILAFSANASEGGRGLKLFFIGNRMSEIEPCGCVKNQLGGVQFEATIYADEKREESIRVDAGGWTNRPAGMGAALPPDQSMKTRYALQAMGGFLDLDAVNVGHQDLSQGRMFFDDVREKTPAAVEPLISANIYFKENPDERAFKPYVIVEKDAPGQGKIPVCIVGVTADLPAPHRNRQGAVNIVDQDYVIKDAGEELKKVSEETKDRAKLLVALVFGTWEETLAIAEKNPQVDVMVSVARPHDFKQIIETKGKTQIVSVHNALGKELGKIELLPGEEGKWALAKDPEWIGVSPKLPAAQEMVDLINQYKKNTEELVVQRPAQVKSTFGSAQYCGSCHALEYTSWQKTAHAHALQTLINKGSQFDPACLKCHTLGFQQDNGFYNWKQSMQMANVQCESCHGPAYEHAQRELLIRNRSIERLSPEEKAKFLAEAKALVPPKHVEAATCQKCHYGENDPHFDYEKKINLVNHSEIDRVAAAAAAAARRQAPQAPARPAQVQQVNPARPQPVPGARPNTQPQANQPIRPQANPPVNAPPRPQN
jgi:hypothetical protein